MRRINGKTKIAGYLDNVYCASGHVSHVKPVELQLVIINLNSKEAGYLYIYSYVCIYINIHTIVNILETRETMMKNQNSPKVFWQYGIITTVGILAIGLTATPIHPTKVQASDPSAWPDPGQRACNAASGVITDHAVVDTNRNLLPGAQINDGWIDSGPF